MGEGVGHLHESTVTGGHHDGADNFTPLLLPNADRAFLPDGITPGRSAGGSAQPAAPNRDDDPASAARVARDLLRSRREDVTLALHMDDRRRFVGDAVVAVGWVQAARLAAHPVLLGAQACRATGFVLVRYRRYGALSATEAEQASFRAIAAACSRHGLAVVDHLVVVATGGYRSKHEDGA